MFHRHAKRCLLKKKKNSFNFKRFIRQHVNPFTPYYTSDTFTPNWKELKDPNKNIFLDFGTRRGQNLFDMAQRRHDLNFVGLEIREKFVDEAREQFVESPLNEAGNLSYQWCNVIYDGHMQKLLESLRAPVQYALFNFPDPLFKKRHSKRRIFSPTVLDNFLAKAMSLEHDTTPSHTDQQDRLVFFATDIEKTYDDAMAVLDECERFELLPDDCNQHGLWISLLVPGDRETRLIETAHAQQLPAPTIHRFIARLKVD